MPLLVLSLILVAAYYFTNATELLIIAIILATLHFLAFLIHISNEREKLNLQESCKPHKWISNENGKLVCSNCKIEPKIHYFDDEDDYE